MILKTTSAHDDYERARAKAIKELNTKLSLVDEKANRERDLALLRCNEDTKEALAQYDRELELLALEALQEKAWLERQKVQKMNE